MVAEKCPCWIQQQNQYLIVKKIDFESKIIVRQRELGRKFYQKYRCWLPSYLLVIIYLPKYYQMGIKTVGTLPDILAKKQKASTQLAIKSWHFRPHWHQLLHLYYYICGSNLTSYKHFWLPYFLLDTGCNICLNKTYVCCKIAILFKFEKFPENFFNSKSTLI